MSRNRPQLMSFPLLDGTTNGRIEWQGGNKSIREVMLNILLTRPGERLMRPEFGAGLLDFIHYPNNETTCALIADAAKRALTRWEPRVELTDVNVTRDPQRLSHVNLSIHYRLRYDGSPGEFDLALHLLSA